MNTRGPRLDSGRFTLEAGRSVAGSLGFSGDDLATAVPFFKRRLGSPFSDLVGFSSPRWTGVEGKLGSPSSLKPIPDVARASPRSVGVEGKSGLWLACGPPFAPRNCPPVSGSRGMGACPSAYVAWTPLACSLTSSGGEAPGCGKTSGRVLFNGVYSLPGVRDLRLGVAHSPCLFALQTDATPGPFAAFLGSTSPALVSCRVCPFMPSLSLSLSLSDPWLRGRCDSDALDRGKSLGLNRARLAFVGDMKDALLLELCSPS